MRSSFVGVISCLLVSSAVSPGAAQAVEDSARAGRLSWSLIPIVFSSPDTDWGFGLLPQVVFTLPETDRQSRVFVAGFYTLEDQYAISAAGSVWLNGGRDNLEAGVETKYWPTDFYGLSAPNADVNGVDYTENVTAAELSYSRDYGGIRLGLSGQVQRNSLDWLDETERPGAEEVVGVDGGWLISAGPSIGVDSRDHVFYPHEGWYANLSTTLTGHVLGGDFEYVSARADVRTYRGVFSHHVLAAQAIVQVNSSGVPFWKMNGVGSVVRGYPSMRFLDRQMVAFQVEYRVVPIVWRIGLCAFGGVGTVARRVDDLLDGRWRAAGGLGLRWVLMRGARIHIRWDFGFGSGSSGDYLDMPEAF